MNCKDCIHNEVCHMREICNNIEEQIKELGCMDFIARADVQEIKHGEWIKYRPENALDGAYFCSTCFKEQKMADGTITPLDIGCYYCPHCGEKMTAMPMCGKCKYGQGAWKDSVICYVCREQIWIPGAPHRKVGEEH